MYVILLLLLSIFSYVVCVYIYPCVEDTAPAKASGRGGGVQVEPQRLAADLGLQGAEGGMDFSMKHEIISIYNIYRLSHGKYIYGNRSDNMEMFLFMSHL